MTRDRIKIARASLVTSALWFGVGAFGSALELAGVFDTLTARLAGERGEVIGMTISFAFHSAAAFCVFNGMRLLVSSCSAQAASGRELRVLRLAGTLCRLGVYFSAGSVVLVCAVAAWVHGSR